MVSDGVISPGHNTFQHHDEEGLQALLKPVSHDGILPAALTFCMTSADA